MAVAMIALFVALGGTSYAVATGSIDSREIKNNTIRGKDVRNGTLGSKDLGDSAKPVRTYGPVAISIGQSANLFSSAGFTVVGRCLPVNTSTRFVAVLAASENGSAFGSGSDDSGGIGPATAEDDRILRQVTSPINQFRHSSGSSDAFSALVGTGKAIEGTIHAAVNGQSRNCRAYGTYTRIK
jgi:hypothetical protein